MFVSFLKAVPRVQIMMDEHNAVITDHQSRVRRLRWGRLDATRIGENHMSEPRHYDHRDLRIGWRTCGAGLRFRQDARGDDGY
jgi:hypothetical protein